ncbi:HAD family hydrolase [Streptomyces sp. NPDC054834]
MDFLRCAEEVAYRELTAPDAWVPYPDTEPVLRALCERGLHIAIVSDFAWDLRIHLARHRPAALIDTCVISYEQGREKPDPQLFLKACADPRATLMVGDNPVRDGAQPPAVCAPTSCRRNTASESEAARRALTLLALYPPAADALAARPPADPT